MSTRRARVAGAVKRGAQLAGLSADLVRARAGATDPAVRQRILDRLGGLHGLPQKIGQVMSLGELDRDDSVEVGFSSLTESGAALPLATVQAIVEEALGGSLDQHFAFFSPFGIAASIGQVHRATLHDGRSVAVKIQYPGIGDAVGLDLGALEWLTLPFGGLGRGFDMAAYRQEIGSMLAGELDYAHEATTLERVAPLATYVPRLEIPEVVRSHSNARVLTMTWLAGDAFPVTRAWSLTQRAQTLDTLVRFFLESVFDARLLHADPHAGNYRFRLESGRPRVGVIDFGCTKALSPSFVDALARLFRLALANDERPAEYLACFVDLGFRAELMEPMAARLPAFAGILLDPWKDSAPFDFDRWELGPRMSEALGEFRWNVRIAGPAEAIFVVRAWQGLVAYARALHAPVALRPLLETALGAYERARTTVRTGSAALQPAVQAPLGSEFVKIRVTEHGNPKVTLTFPGRCADTLEELMPDDLRSRLAAEGTDLAAIVAASARRGHVPGLLFESHHNAQHVRVWLE